MASKATSTLLLPKSQLRKALQAAPRRNLSIFSSVRSSTVNPASRIRQPSSSLSRQAFRRSYADAAPGPVSRKRAGFFRWTWRLVYLSAIGASVWVGYEVYQLRTPDEQIPQDPKKKTLVILGPLLSLSLSYLALGLTFSYRHRLGIRFFAEEG